MGVKEAILGIFCFGEPPSQLALVREQKIDARLTLSAQALQEYLSRSRPQGAVQSLWWQAKDVDGKTRSCHLYAPGGRLRQASCWWIEDEQRGTMVTFGRNARVKEIEMRSPSVGVLSQSGIDIIATSHQLAPGLVHSAKVDKMVINPRPDGRLVGTMVSVETSCQLEQRTLTLRMSNEGFMRGVVSWEGRKVSQFIYPDFNVAGLTDAVLHEAFKEAVKP